MTPTTNEALSLTDNALTLVRVSDDYSMTPGTWPSGDRVFYATTDPTSEGGMGTGWGLVLVPHTDPRHRGMWTATTPTLSRIPGLATDGQTYYGWRVEERYLSAVESGRTRPWTADMSEPERRGVPIEEAYPVGTVWDHVSQRGVTVTGHRDNYVLVSYPGDEHLNREWTRGALDAFGTFVGWAEEPAVVEETTTGGTFSQEDVDRLVREARDAERAAAQVALEEFKETANARAIEYAESNGLCSEFERCMSDIGLMGRDEWREAHQEEYSVTFTVTVRVTSSNSGDAIEQAREELYNELPYPMDQTIEFTGIE